MRARKRKTIVKPELVPVGRGLGRRHAPDSRDRRFAMRAVVPKRLRERDVRRNPGPVLNQGATNTCVGHAWRAWVTSSPVMNKASHPDPFEIHGRALALDEWPDDDYDAGTSVRAGAKVMREQRRFAEFVWASNTADVIAFLIPRGPVVLGTDWHESMSDPLPDGTVKVEGEVAGGHAYLCYGYDADRRRFDARTAAGASGAMKVGSGSGVSTWIEASQERRGMRRVGADEIVVA